MIDVQRVSKSYGSTRALQDVSFSVGKNQILGFLGPNGAGKSTCMKIITTFLSPDEGAVTVDGIDVSEQPGEVRSRIGYLPETAPLYDDMRSLEYLQFVGKARGLSGAELSRRIEWVAEATSIRQVFYKNTQALSKGYRQRLGLAQALIHDPDILILDEPTSGLDPRQIIDIRHLIIQLAKTKTVIFSSHILAEISSVTNRIVIINEGKIVADGRIDELRRKAMRSHRYVVGLSVSPDEALPELRRLDGATTVEKTSDDGGAPTITVTAPLERDLRHDINHLVRAKGWDLLELRADPPSLEETFIALTGKEVVR